MALTAYLWSKCEQAPKAICPGLEWKSNLDKDVLAERLKNLANGGFRLNISLSSFEAGIM